MGRLVWAIVVGMLASTDCTRAESLYRTASDRVEKYGLADGYTFIAPYFTRVETTLWISITKAAASPNSNSQDTQSKPIQSTIYYAGWLEVPGPSGTKTAEIKYAVSCDLSRVLNPGDPISVSDIKPADVYSGPQTVTRVTVDSVFVAANATQPKPTISPVSGSLNASCPPPAATPAVANLSVTFGVTTTPKSRAYLYLSRNAFFSDSVNVGLDSNGMLSSSDSSSTQQITSILTELAQAAGQAFFPIDFHEIGSVPKLPGDPRQQCFTAIASLVKSGPYYINYRYGTHWPRPSGFDKDVELVFKVQPLAASTGQEDFDHRAQVNLEGKTRLISWRNGLLAFYPVPAKATLACVVGKKETIFLSAPSTINLYTASQFVDPQRDFLTGPQDTFTFNAGFIVGHKYVDQSSAKTVVDTITAPIRALVPSISTQQNIQVQTGGGKPEQTTTTTTTTTGAPKSQ